MAVPATWIVCEKACPSLSLTDTPHNLAKEVAIRMIETAVRGKRDRVQRVSSIAGATSLGSGRLSGAWVRARGT
jgi:hypothetical protein